MGSTIVVKRPASMVTASPKATKDKKAIVKDSTGQPTTYGCKHIKMLLEGALTTARDSYTSAIRLLADPKYRADVQTCTKCHEVLTKTFLCLQCTNIACFREAEQHAASTRHAFGIDSRTTHMYCFICHDFIYDPFVERTRIIKQAELTEGNARKKRKVEEPKPSPDDLKYIETNTNPAPCRATGLRGFYNMGSTCFMSVVLQSLVHNPLLRNFYLSDGHRGKECQQINCMSCAMEEVYTEFFTSDKVDGFGPVNLLTTSWKCEQALAGYQQQDAHEYLQFLLNQLHADNGGKSDSKSEDCKCIIHRCFYGKLQSDVTCERCNNVTTAVDPVMDLSLELRMKNKSKKGGDNEKQIMSTIQECLERFTTPERLGANEYNCSKCSGSLHEVTKQLTVKKLPPVLCIQLKRFEHSATGSSKIDTKVRFPMQLDMTPYTTRAKRKPKNGEKNGDDSIPSSYMYELLTVVVHMGQINTGHYISYSKANGQWFRFDDSMVTIATESQVLSAKAYLLFYIVRNFT